MNVNCIGLHKWLSLPLRLSRFGWLTCWTVRSARTHRVTTVPAYRRPLASALAFFAWQN